ncbi:MAG: hypothetical protein AB1Z98_13760 [Nannocystaceae bacterium]
MEREPSGGGQRQSERGRRLGPWLLGLLLVAGCSKGADDGLTSGVVLGDASAEGGGNDTDPGATDGGATGSGATNDGASGQVDGTGSEADTTAGGGEATSATAGDSSGGPPPVCPLEPDDVPCEVCAKGACCAELTACLTDPMCDCALDCYLSGAEPADCFVMCGASPPALELFNCAAPACEGICQ